MSQSKQCGISGGWLLIMLATALTMLLSMLALWLSFISSAELDGRYQSTGQVHLSHGQVLEISHSLQVNHGRFYAMTRQGDRASESTGAAPCTKVKMHARVEAFTAACTRPAVRPSAGNCSCGPCHGATQEFKFQSRGASRPVICTWLPSVRSPWRGFVPPFAFVHSA